MGRRGPESIVTGELAERIRALLAAGGKPRQVAPEVGVSASTVYAYAKRAGIALPRRKRKPRVRRPRAVRLETSGETVPCTDFRAFDPRRAGWQRFDA